MSKLNDYELICMFMDKVTKDNKFTTSTKIASIFNITTDHYKRQDAYKDKILEWGDSLPTWTKILTYFMDDDIRLAIKKYLIEHL